MLASVVMDLSASLMNDSAKTVYSYSAQVPYMNMAINELMELMEHNNVPATNEQSAVLLVTTAMTDIGGLTGPALPTDLVEIQGVYERATGTVNDFIPVTKYEYLPMITTKSANLGMWSYEMQIIRFIGATGNCDVKLNYIASVLPVIIDGTTVITLFNCKSFLMFRTAGLCAYFIGEDKTRADELNGNASLALDRFLGISAKGRQQNPVRHRPFRATRR